MGQMTRRRWRWLVACPCFRAGGIAGSRSRRSTLVNAGGQPAKAPRAYWDAMAKRMKRVFKAPIPDEDIPLIVEYLAKTYGNEQPK